MFFYLIFFLFVSFFFFNDTATTEIYTLSLHDALPISSTGRPRSRGARVSRPQPSCRQRYPTPSTMPSVYGCARYRSRRTKCWRRWGRRVEPGGRGVGDDVHDWDFKNLGQIAG